MRLGLVHVNMGSMSTPATLVAAARAAEEAGFDSLWAGEHIVLPDPQAPPSPMDPRAPALDSLLGAIAAELDGEYRNDIFLAGLGSNMLLAGGLTYLGDRLGVELYFAAIVAFGSRLFNNLAIIRRELIARVRPGVP